MHIFEPKEGQIAGIELIGYRQTDGKIRLGHQNGELLENFPEEMKTPYGVFTLEFIRKNDEDGMLPKEHAGKTIEWGVYV